MPPKKRKRQSRKATQSQRQSQKVIVNIGSKSKRKGRGGLPPPSHMHNLAPTFVTSPQIDYTPILAMLTQQTRSLQPEPIRNPVTPLSSVMATAEQMAGEAAIRRAGPTASSFQPASHMDRELAEKDFGSPSRSSSPSSRSTVASTLVDLPKGTVSVAVIKQMGVAEERGRVQRDMALQVERMGAFRFLQGKAVQAKIGVANQELEILPLEGRTSLTEEQKKLYRQGISEFAKLTDLSPKAQQRTRIQRETKSSKGPVV